ncbi:hypothetical protein MASR1M45_14040 [Candidatus Kapaibacterium sp.]
MDGLGRPARHIIHFRNNRASKGILHATAGYNLFTHFTSKTVFDLQDDDIYWCTADIGWITGHSYLVYGPLSNGATSLIVEVSTLIYPDPHR